MPELGENAGLPPEYTEFFECFNRGEYFRAHEVLEELWLKVRNQPVGDFYKGLIQLAGAFVHVQKGRSGPALAVLALAGENLAKYPTEYERLDVGRVLEVIVDWQSSVGQGIGPGMLAESKAPRIGLMG